MTDAQKRARNKYQKKVKRFTLDFCPTEIELLDHVNQQPNKQGYIKSLIRKDIKLNKSYTLSFDGSKLVNAFIKNEKKK